MTAQSRTGVDLDWLQQTGLQLCMRGKSRSMKWTLTTVANHAIRTVLCLSVIVLGGRQTIERPQSRSKETETRQFYNKPCHHCCYTFSCCVYCRQKWDIRNHFTAWCYAQDRRMMFQDARLSFGLTLRQMAKRVIDLFSLPHVSLHQIFSEKNRIPKSDRIPSTEVKYMLAIKTTSTNNLLNLGNGARYRYGYNERTNMRSYWALLSVTFNDL